MTPVSDPKRPDTFLFDLDGTLIDSVADIVEAVNLLRRELGLPPLPASRVRTHIGDGSAMLVRRALPKGRYSDERLRRFLTLYGEQMLERTCLFPGIRDFLERHCGSPMAVVTNKHRHLTVALLSELGIAPFFRVVIGGDDAPGRKPDPAPVLAALKGLGAQPSRAVLIGDHHTDLQAGRAAGVRTCFCAWGIGEDGGVPCDYRAATPLDLMRLFPGDDR